MLRLLIIYFITLKIMIMVPGTICKSVGMNVSLAGMYTLLREDGENTELGMRRILSLGFSSGFYQPALNRSVYHSES